MKSKDLRKTKIIRLKLWSVLALGTQTAKHAGMLRSSFVQQQLPIGLDGKFTKIRWLQVNVRIFFHCIQ